MTISEPLFVGEKITLSAFDFEQDPLVEFWLDTRRRFYAHAEPGHGNAYVSRPGQEAI